MNGSPGEFLASLARTSAAGGVMVVLVLAAQWLFRKRLGPRWHCALWLLVIVRLLPFSFSSHASLFNLLPSNATALRGTVAVPAHSSAKPEHPPPPADSLVSAGIRAFSTWDYATLIFSVWLAGVLGLGVHVLSDSISVARRLRKLRPITDHAVVGVLQECCERMGVRRPPLLVGTTDVASPALHGLFRPRLLLPAKFTSTFSTRELRFVFLHELAHLRRRDLLLGWVMTALQILHWFNPLVWFAFARWRKDRELACDAAVLEAAGAEYKRAYGETMLRLLAMLVAPGRRAGLVGMLEDKRSLRRRLQMIAGFAPARPSYAAVGLVVVLALVGLTDAQPVSPAPAPRADSIPTTDAIYAPSVSVNEFGSALDEILTNRFDNDRSKFLSYLRAQNKTLRQYRREIEQEIRDRQAREAQVTPLVGWIPQPTALAPDQGAPRIEQVPQVHLRLIQLTRHQGETDETLLTRASLIRARLGGGEKFEALAKEFSDDARRSKGGDWGWQKPSAFREQFSRIAFSLGKGEVSAPILLPEGCFILFVEDRK
ncbi:MAG: M56 family metallopeptidase [Opitutaceae bacterium]